MVRTGLAILWAELWTEGTTRRDDGWKRDDRTDVEARPTEQSAEEFQHQAPYDGLVVVDGNPSSEPEPEPEPEPWVGWSKLMIPAGRNWSFRFKIASDEGLDHFQALARQVWNLVLEIPIAMPIPEHLRRMLAEFHPTKERVLPDWRDGAKNWLHLVHWIGRSLAHPLLRMEPVSWIDYGTFPADEEELKRLVRSQPPDSALLRIKVPVDCLYTESEDAFMASLWALDWIERQIMAQKAVATIEPKASATTSIAPPQTGQGKWTRKEPPREAFEAYKMNVEHCMSQKSVARALSKEYGRRFTQGQISRLIQQVRDFKGVEKPSKGSKPKVQFVDPSRLEMGQREKNARRKS